MMQQPLHPAYGAAAAAGPSGPDLSRSPVYYPDAGGPPPPGPCGPAAPAVPARKGFARAAQIAVIAKRPDFLVTWIAPWFVFSFLVVFFAYAFMKLPSVCILVAVGLLLESLAFLLLRNKSHVWLPLGVTLLVATISGTCVGLFIYDQYACFPAFYANSRPYDNVVATQPAEAVADAGKIIFSTEAIVDTNRSVAFVSETGSIYCAAPVVTTGGTSAQLTVQFWAVGLSCCSSLGDFACDEATDPSAHGGVRVFDNSGFFTDSNKDFYIRARMKAEATYNLVSGTNPLYVRWVKEDNLDFLANDYSLKAIGSLLSVIMMYALASAALAFAVYQRK